jgi:hypothetical protein
MDSWQQGGLGGLWEALGRGKKPGGKKVIGKPDSIG